MLEDLKEAVLESNLRLYREGLIISTFGNVSGIDRETNLVVIKPSGVAYDALKAEHMVVVDLEGRVVEGSLNPSSDTPTHLLLYESFPQVGGIAHSHSRYATIWAQAQRPIPCLGTTHADYFYGDVPITRSLTSEEIGGSYEVETGKVIVETFQFDPRPVPAVLVASHGPFTWGETPGQAVLHMVLLEEVARMALGTLSLNPQAEPIGNDLLIKHFLRKHGPSSYYGQKKSGESYGS
ncbi:MAG TPA: L-ribulose-5-phosphate 4-epimerase [archaeon]|nr:L-ribulose-5-phosphate 4-epimerase [archaeon]